MTNKYNWDQLKSEFLQGDWFSVSAFLQEKNITNNSRSRVRTKGWKEEKGRIQKQINLEVEGQFIESEVSIRTRQAKTGRLMQLTALQRLQDVDMQSSEDVRKMLISGTELERSAVGLQTKDGGNLTQVNLSLGTKTNLDRQIENMDYEEVLGLIAELKRIKQNRNVTK